MAFTIVFTTYMYSYPMIVFLTT